MRKESGADTDASRGCECVILQTSPSCQHWLIERKVGNQRVSGLQSRAELTTSHVVTTEL